MAKAPLVLGQEDLNLTPHHNEQLEVHQPGLDPWVGKTSRRRAWQPTPLFLPGESLGQRSLVGYSLWVCKRVGHDWSDLARTHGLRGEPGPQFTTCVGRTHPAWLGCTALWAPRWTHWAWQGLQEQLLLLARTQLGRGAGCQGSNQFPWQQNVDPPFSGHSITRLPLLFLLPFSSG